MTRSSVRRIALPGVALGAAVIALTACSSGSPSKSPATSASALGHATSGALTITGAYVPEPASPDVAAGYLMITDHSAQGDTLLSASSPMAASVELHETEDAGGVGQMVPVHSLAVPANGSVSFTAGGRHLMLMSPAALKLGQQVPITLRFAHAGAVTVSAPVVPLTGPGEDMSGMSMG